LRLTAKLLLNNTVHPFGVGGTLVELAHCCDEAVKSYRFDRFEVDVCTGELRRDGTRLKLQDKPFQLLIALLERLAVV
jgi:DNA-binding response OmpR family regulator